MKTCSNKNCEQQNPQPLDNFYKRKTTKDGLDSSCKACVQKRNKDYLNTEKGKLARKKALSNFSKTNNAKAQAKNYRESVKGTISKRKKWLKYKYSITPEDYYEMLVAQDYKCKICKTTENEGRQFLDVDHCHTSQKIRGLLCNQCNNGLGRFKDSIELLQSAIEYLSSAP
jgi:hypothetical protein